MCTIQLLLDKGVKVTDVTKCGWLPRVVAAWHDSDGMSKVETTEYPMPSIDASVLGGCDVETNERVNRAARRATWKSLKTGETMPLALCDSYLCVSQSRTNDACRK